LSKRKRVISQQFVDDGNVMLWRGAVICNVSKLCGCCKYSCNKLLS